jgi:hypothetical protein
LQCFQPFAHRLPARVRAKEVRREALQRRISTAVITASVPYTVHTLQLVFRRR